MPMPMPMQKKENCEIEKILHCLADGFEQSITYGGCRTKDQIYTQKGKRTNDENQNEMCVFELLYCSTLFIY